MSQPATQAPSPRCTKQEVESRRLPGRRVRCSNPSVRSFVVGGAGFVGSHLVDRLVDLGPVTVFDDLSVGKPAFIAQHLSSGKATLVRAVRLTSGQAVEAAVREIALDVFGG